MSKERRLGRGLEALLGRPADAPGGESLGGQTAAAGHASGQASGQPSGGEAEIGQIQWLNVYEVDRNPYQPREEFDGPEFKTLCESIKDHGMLQPIVVRRMGDRYQLISGERRLRAATAAGWAQIPACVREADDRQVAELAIVENIQRKDLNPLEKATSFQRYLEKYQCTQDDLARRVKVDRSTIANLIRLLELPDAVQDAIRGGAITQGHARALLPLGDPREQIEFCRRIQLEALSVRLTEEKVQALVRAADAEPLAVVGPDGDVAPRRPVPKTRSEHLASLEQQLRTALGTKVDIRQSSRQRGRVVLHFRSNDEFERLIAHLTGQPPYGQRSEAG